MLTSFAQSVVGTAAGHARRCVDRAAALRLCLGCVFVAGGLYDTLFVVESKWLRPMLGLLVVAGLGGVILLQGYQRSVVRSVAIANWPIHVFTVSFFVVCVIFQGGSHLDQVIAYSAVGYAAYVFVPMALWREQGLLWFMVRLLAVFSALMAIPSFFGAFGVDSLFGLPLSNKPSYAQFSGIIASGGLFEHPEGHALQMAIGLLCSLYVLRSMSKGHREPVRAWVFGLCLACVVVGLVISQGRGAIFGILIALAYQLIPQRFLRSPVLFIGSLVAIAAVPLLLVPRLQYLPVASEYLRVERGLSGREAAWKLGGELIREEPWTGHGFLTSGELTLANKKVLRESGFGGVGSTFHNTFITKAVELGLIVAALYALLYLVPLIRICRSSEQGVEEQRFIRSMMVLILVAAVFRDYNIGGIRSTAMIGAVVFGLANLWPPARGEAEPWSAADYGTHPVRLVRRFDGPS